MFKNNWPCFLMHYTVQSLIQDVTGTNRLRCLAQADAVGDHLTCSQPGRQDGPVEPAQSLASWLNPCPVPIGLNRPTPILRAISFCSGITASQPASSTTLDAAQSPTHSIRLRFAVVRTTLIRVDCTLCHDAAGNPPAGWLRLR